MLSNLLFFMLKFRAFIFLLALLHLAFILTVDLLGALMISQNELLILRNFLPKKVYFVLKKLIFD